MREIAEATKVIYSKWKDTDVVGVDGGDNFGGREGTIGTATQVSTLATTMGLL